THDQEEALALSTRIAVMSFGEVVQEGKPREIYENPRERFVAEFVGKSNLFSARVLSSRDGLIEMETDEGYKLHAVCPASLQTAAAVKKVLISVRPEAIELIGAKDEAPGRNRILGRIAASAYQGSFVEYEIEAAGKAIKANVINPKGKPLFQRGDEAAAVFLPEDVGVIAAE
ncbi:MAG: TOBE domain-containing protein, partial [Acidimicrobiia bacterium]